LREKSAKNGSGLGWWDQGAPKKNEKKGWKLLKKAGDGVCCVKKYHLDPDTKKRKGHNASSIGFPNKKPTQSSKNILPAGGATYLLGRKTEEKRSGR